MSKIKVEDYPDFSKDEESGAVINTNNSAYEQYITSKHMRENKRASTKQELDKMKKDIEEIKNLLQEIINYGKSI